LDNGKFVSYGRKYFANPSSFIPVRQLVIFASGSEISVLLDGRGLRRTSNVAVTTPGMIHYTVQSGTNKGFGTRYIFKNTTLFVPDGQLTSDIQEFHQKQGHDFTRMMIASSSSLTFICSCNNIFMGHPKEISNEFFLTEQF
jgi:hypothetical protein